MSRKTAILNYNSFSGQSAAFINEKKKEEEENAMSVRSGKSNVGKD